MTAIKTFDLFHSLEIFWTEYCRKRLENSISIVLSNSIVWKCCPCYGNILEIELPYFGPVFPVFARFISSHTQTYKSGAAFQTDQHSFTEKLDSLGHNASTPRRDCNFNCFASCIMSGSDRFVYRSQYSLPGLPERAYPTPERGH